MHFTPRQLATDPLAVTRRRRDSTIDRHRPLGDRPRATGVDQFQIWRVEFSSVLKARSDIDADARLLEAPDSAAVDLGKGISHRDDDSCDASADQCFGARRCFSGVATRLKRDVGASALYHRDIGQASQRIDLRMSLAKPAVITFRDADAITNDHTADHRIGFDGALTPAREPDGSLHPLVISPFTIGDYAGA